jgi:hypothetical protein
MVTRILVVAEARADWRMVSHLIDRKILPHAPDWLRDDPENLDAAREWCGLEANTQFTSYSELKKFAKDRFKSALRGAGPIGFSNSAPHRYDWDSVRKVIILALLGPGPVPDVIVYSRNMDRQFQERKASIENAILAMPKLPFVIVLALANAEREAWILNGFVPKNAFQEQRLSEVRNELKFDPCENAENLNAAKHGALKDAKRVWRFLGQASPERESECLDASWEVLRQRGEGTGLTDFLKHVKDRIVPLVPGQ